MDHKQFTMSSFFLLSFSRSTREWNRTEQNNTQESRAVCVKCNKEAAA